MQFVQRQTRNFWISTVLGHLPDVAIGMAVAFFTGSGIVGFFLTIFGLQVFYFLLWLKNTIWQWIFFLFRGRKLMVEHIENFLAANKFPALNDYEDSIEGYLISLVEDDELEPEMRILATSELAALRGPMLNFRVQEGLRLTMAYEEALSNYRKRLDLRAS